MVGIAPVEIARASHAQFLDPLMRCSRLQSRARLTSKAFTSSSISVVFVVEPLLYLGSTESIHSAESSAIQRYSEGHGIWKDEVTCVQAVSKYKTNALRRDRPRSAQHPPESLSCLIE